MKKIFFIPIAFLLSSFVITALMPMVTLTKLEGGTQSIAAYNGKSLMIVTLPIVQTASADSFLTALDTLAQAHSQTLQVIATPSIEDGYNPAIQSQLQQWYRSKLSNTILITEGLYTHKASAQQHILFKWLTHNTENGTFDVDAGTPKFKFFINKDRELYGVLQEAVKISSPVIQRLLQVE